MREQNTKLITLIKNLKSWIQSLSQTDALISSAQTARYVGHAGSGLAGVEAEPPQTKISVTSMGVIFNPSDKSNAGRTIRYVGS